MSVVTGLGCVSGFGWSLADFESGLASGRTSVAPTRRFDTSGQRTRLASEVPPAPESVVSSIPDWERRTWADRFALVACREAIEQAGVSDLIEQRPERVGVFFGGSTAGMQEAEEWFADQIGASDHHVGLRKLGSQQLNAPGDQVARWLGIRGPVYTVSSACASGSLAIGEAVDALSCGAVDIAIAGGADALCRLTYAGFNALRAVDAEPCRPFQTDRAGLNLGEGSGVLILETEEHARSRGAGWLGRILGVGSSCDAHHMTAPHPQGVGAAMAIRSALADAEVEPRDLGLVNAHGTGTPLNDASEWHALLDVVGEEEMAHLPVTSTKAWVGHLLGSAGAIEAVATLLALRSGAVMPMPGDGDPDAGMAVDLVVGAPRLLKEGSLALSTNLAFGGANSALILAAS